jgi:hypothetical protein
MNALSRPISKCGTWEIYGITENRRDEPVAGREGGDQLI